MSTPQPTKRDQIELAITLALIALACAIALTFGSPGLVILGAGMLGGLIVMVKSIKDGITLWRNSDKEGKLFAAIFVSTIVGIFSLIAICICFPIVAEIISVAIFVLLLSAFVCTHLKKKVS